LHQAFGERRQFYFRITLRQALAYRWLCLTGWRRAPRYTRRPARRTYALPESEP
jgi:hypothetical protein